jgi:hypothetical protein
VVGRYCDALGVGGGACCGALRGLDWVELGLVGWFCSDYTGIETRAVFGLW